MSAMAALLAKHGQQTKSIKKGESITGKLTKLTKNEVLMDINAKSEALVLERDKNILNNMLATLKVGDTVTAIIISPESESGQPVVTIRKYMEEGVWKKFEALQKENKKIDVMVNEVTKGGLVIVTDEGLNGFLPQSHMAQGQQPQAGKKIGVYLFSIPFDDLNNPGRRIL